MNTFNQNVSQMPPNLDIALTNLHQTALEMPLPSAEKETIIFLFDCASDCLVNGHNEDCFEIMYCIALRLQNYIN